jgi:DnaA family protein
MRENLPKIDILLNLSSQPTKAPRMQIPLNLMEPPRPHLADGVIGKNAAALSALAALIEGPSPGFASLFLWGAPGSGKTFWLKAWAEDHPESAIYVDLKAPEPSQQALDPLSRVLAQYQSGPPQACLLLDHLDAAHAATAGQLFQLYNAAREVGGRIVCAAACAPLHLQLRDDLRTRLGQSLIFELQELSDQEKRTALQERAMRLGLPLADELIGYLLTRLPRDLGRLMQVVDGLNELALSRQRPATLRLLKELLDS